MLGAISYKQNHYLHIYNKTLFINKIENIDTLYVIEIKTFYNNKYTY